MRRLFERDGEEKREERSMEIKWGEDQGRPGKRRGLGLVRRRLRARPRPPASQSSQGGGRARHGMGEPDHHDRITSAAEVQKSSRGGAGTLGRKEPLRPVVGGGCEVESSRTYFGVVRCWVQGPAAQPRGRHRFVLLGTLPALPVAREATAPPRVCVAASSLRLFESEQPGVMPMQQKGGGVA
ncbi:hypothetical protein BDV09DRAFT_120202 [Aspergillus tetrazonus]